MSYRNRTPSSTPVLCDVTTAAELHVLNGVISEFAIPCSYVIAADEDTPEQVIPIRLREEGYMDPVVAFDQLIEGLTWMAWIDEVDDSIVRLVISSQCVAAIHDDLSCGISVLITRSTASRGDRTDAVLRGTLSIEAGPLVGVVQDLPLTQMNTTAVRVGVDTDGFEGILSNTDTDVQKALGTIDSHVHSLEGTLIEHSHDYDMTPPGVVAPYAGTTAPGGWLMARGQSVSRTTYAALFAAIGTTFGAGDGLTTFALPDLQGRVPVGLHTGQPEFDTMNERDGFRSVVLSSTQIPAHTHGSRSLTGGVVNIAVQSSGTDLTVWGSFGRRDATGETVGYAAASKAGSSSYTDGFTLDMTHTHDSVGGGQAHSNLQPYVVLNYIIKT